MTNEEAYQIFKDNYGDAVREKMKETYTKQRTEISKLKDSITKEKRLKAVDRKENMFPGLIWFVQQKPSETKLMGKYLQCISFYKVYLFSVDHETGLCRECASADQNYETITKFCRSLCTCKTKECENFTCYCNPNEEEELEDECTCEGCDCELCRQCKVKN